MPALLLLATLLLVQAAPPTPPDPAFAARSQRGKELMAAGRYADAAAVYRELVQALPGNAGLVLNLGMALHLAGQDRAALPHLESAHRLLPESLPAALFLGAVNLRLGQAAAAVAPLQTAVRLEPDNPETRAMLVEALVGQGRFLQAEPHLRRLAQMAPSDPAAWFNLGRTYEELAGQAAEDLLRRDSDSPYGLALLAEARRKHGQDSAAFHLYREALAREPGLRGMHRAIAGLYRKASHADWAAIEDQKERALPPPDCGHDALECALAAGKYQEVAASAASVKTAAAAYWLARAYEALAAQAFARLTALPPSAHSHQWTAEVKRDQRRYAESAAEWRKAMALAPDDPHLRVELAVTLRLAQDLAGAQTVLEQAVRAAPDEPEPNYLLGDVLLAQQQPERAIPLLEKAVRLGPKEPYGHGALGRAYALVGRTAEAVPHLQQALAADADGSLRLQLARAYQALGRSEQAKAALEDYEAFRKAAAREGEAGERESLPPPEGAARPPG